MPRYFFVLPDMERPVGGINVALRCVDILAKSGYEAAALYSRSDYTYRFFDTHHAPYFYPPLADSAYRLMSRKRRLLERWRTMTQPRRTGVNLPLNMRPDDVFVIPEFMYPEYCALFPDNRRILLAQDVFGFCGAFRRDLAAGTRLIDDFEAICTTSQASHTAVEQFSKRQSYLIPQAVSRPTLDATSKKKLQIAYMPRKRKEEIEIILGCLKDNPAFAGWDFIKIDGVSPEKLDHTLSESLIFLSFSHQEGFGLPPAEAMAAGCIVIGYTGVGGEEFFRPEFGLPIQDGDIASFVATLEATVTEYVHDPARLDQIRKSASESIHARYNLEAMRQDLLTAWASIDKKMSV